MDAEKHANPNGNPNGENWGKAMSGADFKVTRLPDQNPDEVRKKLGMNEYVGNNNRLSRAGAITTGGNEATTNDKGKQFPQSTEDIKLGSDSDNDAKANAS